MRLPQETLGLPGISERGGECHVWFICCFRSVTNCVEPRVLLGKVILSKARADQSP